MTVQVYTGLQEIGLSGTAHVEPGFRDLFPFQGEVDDRPGSPRLHVQSNNIQISLQNIQGQRIDLLFQLELRHFFQGLKTFFRGAYPHAVIDPPVCGEIGGKNVVCDPVPFDLAAVGQLLVQICQGFRITDPRGDHRPFPCIAPVVIDPGDVNFTHRDLDPKVLLQRHIHRFSGGKNAILPLHSGNGQQQQQGEE